MARECRSAIYRFVREIASVSVLGFALCHCLSASADTFDFNLVPTSGIISGSPGSTVGWGYTIVNNSTSDWLVTTALSAGTFSNGLPQSLFDFPVVAPLSTVTQQFNMDTGNGLFQISWDISAVVGSQNSGSFGLSAEWWNGNPSAGGSSIANALDAGAVCSGRQACWQ